MFENEIRIVGHLARDPEYHAPENEKKQYVRFTVAVNRFNDERADFFDCVAFGKLADTVDTFIHKGSFVMVGGSMECDPYEAKDGTKRYPWRLKANGVKFLDKKGDGKKNDPGSGDEFVPEGFEKFESDIPF